MSERKDLPEFQLSAITLEAPTAGELDSGEVTGLFPDGGALTAIKLGLLESALELVGKDETYEGFTRGLLLNLMRSIKCEAGSLFEVDHENSQLFFRASTGQSSDKVGSFMIPMGQGIVGHVAESRQIAVVHDVAQEKRHLKSIQTAVDFECKNLVAVPVLVRGQIYGVLELLNRMGEASFTERDVELMQYYAGVCSRVIELRLMLAWALRKGDQGAKAA